MPYPDFHPNAITFRLPSGQAYTIPANPTGIADRRGSIQVNEPSLDGTVSFDWGLKLSSLSFAGITSREGIAPWVAFRRDFLGQRCTYTNALTQEAFTIKIIDIDLEAQGQHPATWRWTITAQESSPFTVETGRSYEPGKVGSY